MATYKCSITAKPKWWLPAAVIFCKIFRITSDRAVQLLAEKGYTLKLNKKAS